MKYDLNGLTTDTAIRLRALRESQNLSPESLSETLSEEYGISVSHDSLRNYEIISGSKAGRSNGMRAQTLRVLSHYYGVSADYLLGLSENPYHDGSVRQISELSDHTHGWIRQRHLEYKRGNECSLDTLLGNASCQRLLRGLLTYSAAATALNTVREIREQVYADANENLSPEAWKSFDQTFCKAIEDQASQYPNKKVADYMISMMQLFKIHADECGRGLSRIDFQYHQLLDLVAHGVERDLRELFEDLNHYNEGGDAPHKDMASQQANAYWKLKYLIEE